MKKWICLFVLFVSLQASAQYSYTYTDPCTLQSKSVFVPAGGGVVVNYFDNHNTFTANDFSSGAFDTWIAQVSQQNSNSPCESVTTAIVNTVSNAVVSNTVGIITNVVSISSLAQTMASVMTSTTGGALTSTAESISNVNTGGSSDSSNQDNSNDSTTGNNTGGSSTNANSNQGNSQGQGNSNSVQGSGTNNNNQGGTTPAGDSKAQGVASSGNNQTQGGNQEAGASVGGSGNTANSVSNSIDGGSSDGSSTSTAETEEGKSGGGSNLANSLSNAADGGGADSGSSSSSGGGSGSSKKESAAKASTGALIASGDMVVIANADREQPNQYKFVGSITHANTRGTRIKGVLFNYTTVVNNFNVTFYKSYINKSRKLNTVLANSTMVNTDKDLFNTTTALESYKINKKVTGMFGLNFTAGKLGERNFYNLSAVVGGHSPFQVSRTISTSVLVLGIYSPFTQFYEGQWWSAGVLVVPFNSWDFKLTKTFKFNISATAVYSYGESFLNYQILTGGKINF